MAGKLAADVSTLPSAHVRLAIRDRQEITNDCGLLLAPAELPVQRRLRIQGSQPPRRPKAASPRVGEKLSEVGVNFIALLDGNPAGMASGVSGEDATPELISMWVSPAGRGKGIGDVLVQAVTRWAWLHGAAVLRLAAAEDNEQATALYRRNGFASTGELPGPLPDGIRMEKVMLKQLRPPASHR